MKPDYKNWVPKGMVYGLAGGTGVIKGVLQMASESLGVFMRS